MDRSLVDSPCHDTRRIARNRECFGEGARRKAAVDSLDAIESDASIQVVALTEVLWHRAYRLYRERRDKEWGIIDCVSFVVMEDQNITDAPTTDEHFQQAGFRALLRHTPVV